MFNIKRTQIDVYPDSAPNSSEDTIIIRHYDGNGNCVAEQYLTEDQMIAALENNKAIKVVRHPRND